MEEENKQVYDFLMKNLNGSYVQYRKYCVKNGTRHVSKERFEYVLGLEEVQKDISIKACQKNRKVSKCEKCIRFGNCNDVR